jgi:hypothetical protein
MSMTRSYTTTILSNDGRVQAEVLSVPRFFDGVASAELIGELARTLGVERGSEVSEASLPEMLRQIAYETSAARTASPGAIDEIIAVLTQEPVVIVERSPAVGDTLLGISQSGPAYILIAEGKPFLALGVEAGLVIIWFIAGPIKGAREGLREGTQQAFKAVSAELVERALRERFARRRNRP